MESLVFNLLLVAYLSLNPCTDRLSSSDFHIYRGGLTHSASKFEKEGFGRVAFLGGSITYNPGWRDSVSNLLRKRFPGTSFEFINAGIPSLGSLPDAFRFEKDVLSKGKIDLLFVEAAVNDRTNAYPDYAQVRSMEGIVRHARAANPETDIVFMYFVDPDKISDYNKGILPEEIANHERVADHYNIPSVNLAKEVTERINNREFTWAGDFIDLHPSPFGQMVYYRSISELLIKCWEVKKSSVHTAHTLPAKLDPFCYDKGRLVDVKKKNATDGWVYDNNWSPSDKASTREDFVNVPMLVSTKPGALLKFSFKGTTAGVAVAAGPDAGIIEYSIDGQEWKSVDLFTQWSGGLHLPWFITLGDDLLKGSHTLRIRLSNGKNPASTGTACRIRYFYVNLTMIL
jgi:sialidase-1